MSRQHPAGVLARLVLASFLALTAAAAHADDEEVASAAEPCPGGMILVPGGSFNLADESAGGAFAAPSALCWDKTEVTVGAWKKCVKSQKCDALPKSIRAPRLGLSDGDAGRVSKRCNGRRKRGYDKHPVNCVDHETAEQYCRDQGKRLPTEQEWEWAARGATEARVYPWGDGAPGRRACWNGKGNAKGKGRRRTTCAVGTHRKGESEHGIQDLAGNVWEWTASRAGDGYTIRGGGFTDEQPSELRAARRGYAEARDRLDVLGFRCVKDVPPAYAAKEAADEAKAAEEKEPPRPADEPVDDPSVALRNLKPRIALPARPAAPYCAGQSKECPPCMALVRGGSFRIGGKHGPLVRVPDTCVDLTEVTTRTYGDCVEAGGCIWPTSPTCKANSLALPDHPMNCVSFDQARTFCRAVGKELPTEAQWEWVARGGDEGRIFPWGDEVPEAQLCWRRAVDEEAVQVEGDSKASVLQIKEVTVSRNAPPPPVKADEGTCPVATYPAGKSAHGLFDLAGNVWEWTRTKDPTEERARLLRGGSWENSDKIHVSAIGRLSLVTISSSRKIGFRCVAPPGSASAHVAPAAPAAPPAAPPAPAR